jgi:2-phospho-L-lactate guanylyltransferase
MSGDGDLWSVLVPVKRLDRAKTRLALRDGQRADLALAMAMDTVRAAVAATLVAEVVVITDDDRAGKALVGIGARIVGDTPDAGLNPALRHGAGLAATSRVVALSSDLPALRPGDLDEVLSAALVQLRTVVADRLGTGTTALTAATVDAFEPAFGVDSLAAHVAAGAIDLSATAAIGIRHDVDTVEALQAAVALGVGVDTGRAVSALDLG